MDDGNDSGDETGSIAYGLHNAAEAGDHAFLGGTLLGSGATSLALRQLLRLKDMFGCTPLHVAVLKGQVQCVEVLLRAGASPDSRCDGTPALSLAVCHGLHPGKGQAALRMVELLLQHGAQPFDMDDGGRTALHWAAVAQLLPVVQLLLAVGVAAQQKHAAAVTAAAAAAAAALRPDSGGGGEAGGRGAGRDEEAALLPAQLPCLAEVQDADGNTALHLAARFSDPGAAPLVQFLLQPGQGWEPAALAKQRNREGDAALHLAVRHNRPAAVHALLGLGRLLDRKQRGPTELARIRGHRALLAAITSARKATATNAADWATAIAAATSPATPLPQPSPTSISSLAAAGAPSAGAGGAAADRAAAAAGVAEASIGSDPGSPSSPAAASAGHASSSTLHSTSRAVPGGVLASLAPAAPATLLVLAPEECCLHHTAPQPWARGSPDPPPENPHRLAVLTSPGSGVLHTLEFQALDWETRGLPDACLADLLRCHHWPYVRDMAAACAKIPDSPAAIGLLDPDTAISHHTFAAALKAAGACCAAVDRIMTRKARRVFCAVRPPGHHAGPQGVVPNANDPHVSHGFCLFSNLAIAAAYAVNVYRHQGVRRVALLDFDVHHGNGTEAVVSGTQPSLTRVPLSTPYSEGEQCFPVCKPWLDPASDADNIFFASVQGYGPRPAGVGWFYPGSGMTDDSRPPPPHPPPCTPPLQPASSIQGSPPTPSALGAATDAPSPATCPTPCVPGAAGAGVGAGAGADPGMTSDRAPPAPAAADWVVEDPDNEFTCCSLDVGGEKANATLPLPLPLPLLPAAPPLLGSRPPAGCQARGPRIINVGVPGPGARRQLWRRAWRDKILPALVNFKPDMIFVSAGFDAHKKEDINMRFVGVEESDYEWLTDQIVQVANRCCGGRVVSALEGGYNIRGGHTSAFARSVGAHVRALAEAQDQHWDPQDAEMERQWEARRRESLGCSRTHTLASPLHPAASGSGGWGAQGLGQQGGDPAPTPPLQHAGGRNTSSERGPAAGPQPADAAAAGVPTGHGAAGMAGAGAASALGQLTTTMGDGGVAAAAGAAGSRGGDGAGEGGGGAGLGAAGPAGQEGATSPPATPFSPNAPSEPLTGIKRRRRGSGGQVNYAELNAQLECARQL